MELSQHVSVGGHSTKHNLDNAYRSSLDHVDGSLCEGNVVLRKENLRRVYSELFDGAVEAYNARQKRSDRKIGDYYEKVRDDARGHKGVQNKEGKRLAYEQVVGIGNRDTFHASNPENVKIAERVYSEYVAEFERRFPNLRVFEAVVHVDESEGGIHLHNAYVPWGEGYKKGMERQQSLSKACENMGFDHKELDAKSRQLLEEVCLRNGIERLEVGSAEHHKPTPQYKEEQRELERARAEHLKAQRVLSARMATASRSVGRLTAQEAKLKRTNVFLAEEKRQAIAELEAASAQLESAARRADSLACEVEGLKKEVGALERSRDALEREVSTLERRKSMLEEAVALLEEKARAIAEKMAPYLPDPIMALARLFRDHDRWGREAWHQDMDEAAEELASTMPSRADEEWSRAISEAIEASRRSQRDHRGRGASGHER